MNYLKCFFALFFCALLGIIAGCKHAVSILPINPIDTLPKDTLLIDTLVVDTIPIVEEDSFTYIGNLHNSGSSNYSTNGYQSYDTTYIDTFIVRKIGQNRIEFITNENGGKFTFDINPNNSYFTTLGSHIVYQFFLLGDEMDSLKYNYHSYGGNGQYYINNNSEFIGLKQ